MGRRPKYEPGGAPDSDPALSPKPAELTTGSACRDAGLDLFFPEGRGRSVTSRIRKAKAICQPCPVRDLCLRWALDTRQDWGVWGGLTRDQRRALRRQEQRAAATQKRNQKADS